MRAVEQVNTGRKIEISASAHLGNFVLGAVDGTVATFAIVAGAHIDQGVRVALILGVANYWPTVSVWAPAIFLSPSPMRL